MQHCCLAYGGGLCIGFEHTLSVPLAPADPGPPKGDGVEMMVEQAGDGMDMASGVWLKSSFHMGEPELNSSFSSWPRNLMSII